MTDLTNGNCWHCGKKVEKSSERNPKTCDFYFYCNAECKREYQKLDQENRILTNQTHHSRYENKPKFFGKASLITTQQPVVEVSTIGEEVTDTKKKKPGRMKKKEKNDLQ